MRGSQIPVFISMPSRLPESSAFATLRQQLAQRIMILDGATGTMIQQYKLSEAQYRGDGRSDISQEITSAIAHATGQGIDVKGNNELLSLTRPEVITEIHHQYLAAGADIVETNTFGATTIAQEDYRLPQLARMMNLASARLARQACDAFSTPDRPRFVAGAIGPHREPPPFLPTSTIRARAILISSSSASPIRSRWKHSLMAVQI